MRPIDIVMVTWKRENITYKMLEALKRNTQTPYRLIMIDNGSLPWEAAEYMKEADIYVKLDKNVGLEHAKWIGMSFVESEYFISTDNDILPYAYSPIDWLGGLKLLMDNNPEYGAIALRPQVLVGTGNIFQGHEEDDILEFSHVPGYLRIMRTDLTLKAGAWNDKRPLRGHEEYWISEKFKEMGYKVGWSPKIRCWHLFGEKDWGYYGMKVEEHGHTPVSGLPHDDKEEILKQVGVQI